MSSRLPEPRLGVIVVHPFGPYREAQFLDDPGEIERLIADGESWRVTDAVLLDAVLLDAES